MSFKYKILITRNKGDNLHLFVKNTAQFNVPKQLKVLRQYPYRFNNKRSLCFCFSQIYVLPILAHLCLKITFIITLYTYYFQREVGQGGGERDETQHTEFAKIKQISIVFKTK